MLPPLILTAIKVLSQEARSYTGRTFAYGLSHDDFLALYLLWILSSLDDSNDNS